MSQIKILLIGSNGQVGWELQSALSPFGRVVTAARNHADVIVDLSDPASIRQSIQNVKPNWIINAAAYTAVDKAELEKELAMRVNGIAPGVIAEEAKNFGCPLIHYSTDYVFDGKGIQPYREDAAVKPLNVYGETKLEGERAIEQVGGEYLILRTSWVFGRHGNNFVKTMIRLAKDRDSLSIINDQHGCPTNARDIAEVTAALIQRHVNGGTMQWGLFHYCGQPATNWHDFAQTIFQRAHALKIIERIPEVKAITTSEYPTPATRPLYSVMDVSKFESTYFKCPDWRERLGEVILNKNQ